MKRTIVPTSPQYPTSDTHTQSSSFWPTLWVLLLGIIGGGLAGLGIASYLLTQYGVQAQQIVVETSGSTAVSEVASLLSPSIRERSVSIVNGEGKLVGEALIVTADGLLVTAHALQEDEVLLSSKRQPLSIVATTQDPLTGLYILKTEQTGLPVVTWATADEVSVGQRGFVLQLSPVQTDWLAERSVASVHSLAHLPQSLQHFEDRYQLDTSVVAVAGTPFVSLNGHILGMLVDDHQVIPGEIIDQQLQFFIEHETFRTLPELTTTSLFYSATEGQTGFLVTQSGVAAIQVGDIITGVNGQALSKADQLLPFLLRFPDGETVKIDLKRAEQPIQVEIEL